MIQKHDKSKSIKPARKKDNRKKSRQERGYDRQWEKLRDWKLRVNPECEYCLEHNKFTPAEEVDHIIPFKGLSDPLRLDRSNLKSTCKPCHYEKTAKERRDRRVGDL